MSEELPLSTGMPSDEMAQYLQMFVDETTEQLDALVEVLLALETDPSNTGQLNESFRLIHSIKGAAAMMGLDGITLLTHHLENHFERLRSGVRTLDRPMMNLVLKCVDYLRDATEKLRDGKPIVSSPELIELLTSPSASKSQEDVSQPSPEALIETTNTTHPPSETDLGSATVSARCKRLIVYLENDIELPELKAELVVAQLRSMGMVVRTSPEASLMERVADLRTLQVWLETDCSDEALLSVSNIVGVELVEIDTWDDDANTDDPPSHTDVEASASVPAVQSPTVDVINDQDSGNGCTHEPPVQTSRESSTELTSESSPDASTEQSQRIDRSVKVGETMRVDLQRLDRLMNLTGELIVQRARFAQLGSQLKETFQKSGLHSRIREVCEILRDQLTSDTSTGDRAPAAPTSSERHKSLKACLDTLEEQLHTLELGRRSYLQLHEAIDQFSRVSEGLQRGVLDTRMIPVGPLFNRFKRTIRDISEELGKKVHYVIRGENTELDKRMIDELGDPLIHLVRNAIDHGLESEEERRRKGKPAVGTLSLEAEHRGNNVLITIRDDGAGINCDKVRRRAVERGLATEAELELMSDFEVQQFIWAPGFSTADVVSDLSGRGVGMDIVRNRIRELSGTIEVRSVPGEGTQFVLRLPLTLAIIRCLLFELDHGIFAAPIEHVREIISVNKREIHTINQRNTIDVRGEFLPLVRIGDIFDWGQNHAPQPMDEELSNHLGPETLDVLILSAGSKLLGLVVNDLMGCQDIVVKSLDENFMTIPGLAGASILGDGTVCLLCDVASCIELARTRLRQNKPRTT